MTFKVPEIELNFCNSCSADCFICSSAHGEFNKYPENKLMLPETFDKVMARLHEIDFDIIQTSGNGDCFLNPWFIDYLKRLRSEFPDKQIHNYSSFASYSPKYADIIIEQNLINKQHTRIETLDMSLWKRTARMDVETAFQNIQYFAKHPKRKTLFSVGYFDLRSYIDLCKRILDKKPLKLKLTDSEVAFLKDEFFDILRLFKDVGNLEVTRINM